MQAFVSMISIQIRSSHTRGTSHGCEDAVSARRTVKCHVNGRLSSAPIIDLILDLNEAVAVWSVCRGSSQVPGPSRLRRLQVLSCHPLDRNSA